MADYGAYESTRGMTITRPKPTVLVDEEDLRTLLSHIEDDPDVVAPDPVLVIVERIRRRCPARKVR